MTFRVLICLPDMVLEDVTEYDYTGSTNKMSKILLNGNNICMVRRVPLFVLLCFVC